MRTSTTKLGAAIKSARKNKKLTQMELSEELGITPRYLQGLAPHESLLSPELEELLYFIHYKCNQREISVLLSTAKALVDTREEVS